MSGPVQLLQICQIQSHPSIGKISGINGACLQLCLRRKKHRRCRLSQLLPQSRKTAPGAVRHHKHSVLQRLLDLPDIRRPVALRNIPLVSVINLRSDLSAQDPVAEIADENFNIHKCRAVPGYIPKDPVVIRLQLLKPVRVRIDRGNHPLTGKRNRERNRHNQKESKERLHTGLKTEGNPLFPRPEIAKIKRRNEQKKSQNTDSGSREAHRHVRAGKPEEKSLLPGSGSSYTKLLSRRYPEFSDKKSNRRRTDNYEIVGRHRRRMEMHGKAAVHVSQIVPVQHRVSYLEGEIQQNSLAQILQKALSSRPVTISHIEQQPEPCKERNPEPCIPEDQKPYGKEKNHTGEKPRYPGQRLLFSANPVCQHADKRGNGDCCRCTGRRL